MSILVGATSACAGAAGQSGAGFTIDQSLRFRGAQKLEFTPSGIGNRQIHTISVWVKRGAITSKTPILEAYNTSTSNAYLSWTDSTDRIQYRRETGGGGVVANNSTTADFRDPNAWYHIVFVYNSTESTAADRTKFYVNGVLAPHNAFNNPSLNENSSFTSSLVHRIGRSQEAGAWSEYYLAEYFLIDGQALDPTDFAEYNDDGVWIPKEYTGTFGTNGWHLTFDSSQTNGIGHDSSGNDHHFTASDFDTTAISSSNFDNDIDYEDTPTNNHPTLNPLTKSDTGSLTAGTPVWSEANLLFRAHNTDDTGTHRVRSTMATMGVTSGKWYYEVTRPHITSGVTPNNSLVMGWSTSAPPHTSPAAGSGWTDIENYAIFDGFNGYTKATGATAQSPQSTPSEAADQILGYAFDFDATSNNVKLYHNGTLINTMSFDIGTSTMLPMAWSGYGSTNAFNYGQRPFVYTPPTDHVGLASNLLPEPTIKNGKEYFGILTYTGDGATTSGQTVTDTDAVQFTPDLVWIKKRGDNGGATAVREHILIDSVRGKDGSYYWNLSSNDALAETSSDHVSAIGEGSITVHDITSGTVNQNLNTFVAWCWKAGGTAVSNTDGDITSSVSANTEAGFSIVSYSGSGTSGDTVGHGLSTTPEWVIIKNRSSAENWQVKHTALNANQNLELNSTNAADTEPGNGYISAIGSSTITLTAGASNQNNVNASGNDYIIYAWHSVEGYSKIGSFSGNANADGSFIYLGFRPAFFLWKRTDSSGSWGMIDSTRNTHNPLGQQLFPNTTGGEATYTICDFLSNGIKMRNSFGDTNTGTIAFLAFAENPFGGENAPPATAR